MTPGQIIEEIQRCTRALTVANDQYKTKRVILARKKATYQVAYAKKLLTLRKVDNYPANMCDSLAKGDEEIAKLSLEKEMAECDVDVTREGMNNLRAELEALRSLLTWQRVELKNS